MARYTVKADSITGRNGRVFKKGDEVTELSFLPGAVGDLEKGNFIEKIDEQPEIIPGKNRMTLGDVTIGSMKTDLIAMRVEFPKNASKSELFEIWKKV